MYHVPGVIISVAFFAAFFLTILAHLFGGGRDWNRKVLATLTLVLAIVSII